MHDDPSLTFAGAWQPARPAARTLLSEHVAQQIERFISGNGLGPGDKLPSGRELTARYGVSRTVVRDALAVLEQRGLVTTRPGSGVFVCDGGSAAVAGVLGLMLRQNAISLPELMETRDLLETHNAAMAARRAVPTDLDALDAAIRHMREARGAAAFVDADVAFHEVLGRAAGNRVLTAFVASLRPLLVQGMMIGTVLEGAAESAIEEHTAIAGAVRAHDPDAARRLMRDHLLRSFGEWARAGYIK